MPLKRGDTGEEVKRLQTQLKSLGFYRGYLDGDYGPKTMKAVRTFQQQYMVDGTATEYTIGLILSAIKAWSADLAPLAPVPHGLREVENKYGMIEYEEHPNLAGWVVVTNDFESVHITNVDLPVVGKMKVNSEVVSSLSMVLRIIDQRGLDKYITQFGCYAPRHKMHDPDRGLSTHAWACAVDINWDSNPVGAQGNMDPGIVQAFEGLGWTWGGRWRYPDPMHFQLATGY